jgi:hypothetical protein
MKTDVSHTFHSIPKSEFQNFVNFLNAKQLKISNVGDGNARADRLIDDDDDDEPAPGKKSRARADDDEDGGAESSEVWGAEGLKLQGSGFRVNDLSFRVYGFESGFRVQGL